MALRTKVTSVWMLGGRTRGDSVTFAQGGRRGSSSCGSTVLDATVRRLDEEAARAGVDFGAQGRCAPLLSLLCVRGPAHTLQLF